MSSYSSPLPPYVTPGWNDPPTNLGSTDHKANGTRLFSRKYRRPVDPSIQGTGFANSLGKSLNPQESPFYMGMSSANSAPQMSAEYRESSPQPYTNGVFSQQPTTVQQPDERTRALFDAFTVPSALYQQPYDFAHIRGPTVDVPSNLTTPSPAVPPSNPNLTADYSLLPPSFMVPPVAAPPIETNPSHLIYTPPNVIGEQRLRPTTSPDPASYIAPKKAAGDVSLNGLQLVQFITKATLRLPPGVTRDGIQLRIAQLHDLVISNGVSDGCIKKLNFVVDALDRHLYEEGLQFFEQLQALFPEETRSGWAQGVRLLLQELKRPPRVGSASLPRTDTF